MTYKYNVGWLAVFGTAAMIVIMAFQMVPHWWPNAASDNFLYSPVNILFSLSALILWQMSFLSFLKLFCFRLDTGMVSSRRTDFGNIMLGTIATR
ncbi:hypothetical protein [uncultured Algimonas sp.]|uniref:hypothetical protein n=1 Tax=uncultured Algimonas sp. TaxID=1547920 RepID=UPI002615944F|nr:hypothetical protein [uncultured Algimonas sp.]